MDADDKKDDRRGGGKPALTDADRAALETPAGRENVSGADRGTLLDRDLRDDNAPDWSEAEFLAPDRPGGDIGETPDGLDEIDEAIRHSAEDTPTGDGVEDRLRETPVFERPLTAPKV
jgi:hypothetical protein